MRLLSRLLPLLCGGGMTGFMICHMSPAEMTPDDRFREITLILARGVLRARQQHHPASGSTSEQFSESVPHGLDVPPESRLSVLTG